MLPPPLLVGKAALGVITALALRPWSPRAKPVFVEGPDAAAAASVVRSLNGDDGFWPTPWLGGFLGGHLQTIWYGLHLDDPDIGAVDEERWQTADGGTIGLAWPAVPDSMPASAPIALILPGLCGSVDGTGWHLRSMIANGLRPVVLHARGCGIGLTSPCFNLFGSTDDLREAISRIAAARPEAPLCLYGISAGTALLVRYLGEEGAQTPVVAAVANCPGYDIAVCLTRVGWLYDAGYYLKALKRHWLEGENGAVLRAHDPQLCERLQHAPDMHSFMVAASPLAVPPLPVADGGGGGGGGADEDAAFTAYLQMSNPMGVARQIDVPSLILNADDDPVCDPINVDENAAPGMLADGARQTVLLRFPAGGHCIFAEGLRARRWGDELAAGFLAEFARRAKST